MTEYCFSLQTFLCTFVPMSFPAPFLEMLQHKLPDEWQELVDALKQDPPVSIRANPFKEISLAYLPVEQKVNWCDSGFYLASRPSFTYDPAFHAGAYYVQEAASMFLEQFAQTIFSNNENPVVLDLCAAPGGKSTHLLSLMNGRGFLIANEIVSNRNAVLRQNISKWGEANCIVTQNEANDFGKLENLFDVIVVDAPCSGEGMFRKDRTAVEEWSEKNVANCIFRQREILENVLPALKPNGFLIYSTCTFEAGENENQIEFLKAQGFTPIYIRVEAVNTLTYPVTGISRTGDGYAFYPHKTKGEGFFIACLQKTEEDFRAVKTSPMKEKIKENIFQWIKKDSESEIVSFNDEFHLVAKSYVPYLSLLRKSLRIKQEGTVLGTQKGKDFIPAPEFAFSRFLNEEIPKIELDEGGAIRFLKCENIHFADKPKGWYLATYKGLGLGWLKVLDNRTNNYFPNNWRILK